MRRAAAYSPATLARSLAAMGSDANRNTSMSTEHTRHTIHVLAKEPEASNSTPETMEELILQPQSEIERVREFLREEGYTILAEDMVLEDGKFYPMMKVQYQGENVRKALEKSSAAELDLSTGENVEVLKLSDLYGGLLLQNRHPVLKTFLEKEKLIYTGIKENLKKQPESEKIRTRLAEVEDTLHYNELALQFYV